jgi:hypothetical protein
MMTTGTAIPTAIPMIAPVLKEDEEPPEPKGVERLVVMATSFAESELHRAWDIENLCLS